ncbi:putative phosphoheptose isomerase [Candidatus Protochlamydia naegleriophila]|uniref:Putative phosphoheptose isomerase n=1 Tax=Candidatus Protochlamydia naegleriophila TaxID=389348 RepID=A0A0U5JH28_9BACT|nr:SIS domain-containing protein [Candidatus Protochlamydia naegleriophila]CUI17727.1 putative phosphoheptose isomerase [Candidatus Protochlamydia naegleriophila]
MKKKILQAIDDCIQAVEQLKQPRCIAFMEETAAALAACFQKGCKIIIAGNGGSLCDASHFAEELTGYFRGARRALPAIALSEPGHITCTANDKGFEWVFARGIEAYGKPGDIFIGLTTSGNSPNMIMAFEQAKQQGLQTVAFLGKSGGKLKGVADLELIIEGFKTSDRIQEAHMAAIHLIIELVEAHLFLTDAQPEASCPQMVALD